VLCRSLLAAGQIGTELSASSPDRRDSETAEESHLCPICKIGRLVFIELLTADALACLPAPVIADTS